MLDNFLKKSWNPLVFRIFSTVGFIFMLMVLYFGSLKLIFNFKSSTMMFVLWTLWWPVLYITLPLLGRFWCGFLCPIGLTNEIGNSFSNKKRDPLIKYAYIPFVLFFIIVLWEQISGLFFSPQTTILFLVTFFLSAFIVGIILPRWGFCKHFCPIGTILGPFSRLSILSIRTDKSICEQCETKECIRGGKVPACPMFNHVPTLSSNKDCLLCTNCIKNCPHNSAKLVFVRPGEELRKQIKFNLSESLFIVALLGFALILTSRGTQFFRIFDLPSQYLRVMDFTLAIGGFLLIYILISIIQSKLTKENSSKRNMILGGYVLLPLAFSVMFFLIVFGFLTPLANIPENYIALSKYISLAIGVIWSLSLTRSLYRKPLVPILLVLAIASLWFFVLIPGPLNQFPDISNTIIVQANETINIEAFSMGFNPSIIKVKQGEAFYINITNRDIVHSFDIDDMNLHITLQSGEARIIKISPTDKGEFKFTCNIPGHKEAGMKGVLIVE